MTKKLRITQEQAITECKELWAKIEETGLSKRVVVETYFPKIVEYVSCCPLCEYCFQFCEGCSHCPLIKQFGKYCGVLGYRHYGCSTKSFFKAIRNLK